MHHAIVPDTLYSVIMKWNRPYVVLTPPLQAWLKTVGPCKLSHSLVEGCMIEFDSEADLKQGQATWGFIALQARPKPIRKRGIGYTRYPVDTD